MLPYYFLVIIPILVEIFKIKRSDCRQESASVCTFFIILFLLLSLRSNEVGRDLPVYRDFFFKIAKTAWDRNLLTVVQEPAYYLLNKAVSLFTDNFQWLLVVCALITIIPIAIVYKSEVEDSVWTISLFVFMSTFIMLFSGLRQSIAMALGMLAFQCAKKHRPFRFLLIVTLATLFHRSAFILLVLYPLYHVKITKKWLFVVIPSFVAIFVFNRSIFSFLTSFLADYYEGQIKETGAYGMLILLLLLSFYSFVIADEAQIDDSTRGMRNILLLATALQMFAPLHMLAMRMNYYFLLFVPLAIPKIAHRSPSRYYRLVIISKYVMVVFFFAYFFINAPRANSLDTFPYKFFWE